MDIRPEEVKRSIPRSVERKLAPLLEAQYMAAATEMAARWHEFDAGRGTLALLLAAANRLMDAEFALSSDQIAPFER